MGRGAERAQDVGRQGQVQHLLLDHVDEGELPGLDAGQLLRRDAFLHAPLQGKLGVKVLAEQAVFEFAGLTEQVDELLPALNSQGRFGEGPVRRPGSGHTRHCRWKAPEYALNCAPNTATPIPRRSAAPVVPRTQVRSLGGVTFPLAGTFGRGEVAARAPEGGEASRWQTTRS